MVMMGEQKGLWEDMYVPLRPKSVRAAVPHQFYCLAESLASPPQRAWVSWKHKTGEDDAISRSKEPTQQRNYVKEQEFPGQPTSHFRS